MTKIQKIFTLILCSFLFVACGDELEPPLPYVQVDATFVLVSYPELITWPSAAKKSGYGFNRNGVILVRIGQYDFRAFDATCTRDIDHHKNGSLSLDGSGYAVCPKCQTKYFLYNTGNAPIWSNDGKVRLQEYRASFNSSINIVRVTN